MSKTYARGEVAVTALSVLTALLIGCSSNKPTVGQQNLTCEPAQTLCNLDAGGGAGGPYCANLQTENANCGECGHPCAAGAVCNNGHCDLTCVTDETLCGADADAGTTPYCANLLTDNANCGCCGNACGPSQACRDGRCDNMENYSFFVFADMHVGPVSFNATVQVAMNQMTQIDAHAVGAFSNGDLVDTPAEGTWKMHDGFVAVPGFQLNEPCAANFGVQPRYFASVGDHEIGPGSWYTSWNQHLPAQQNLGQNSADGIYYSVKFANAFFVMLDSEHQSSAQTDWLRATLGSAEAQDAQLKFMFFHEPAYSCSGHHAPLAAALPWVDLAEQYKVNVIFGAHTHIYTRTCPKRGGKCTGDNSGIIFVETGAVGGLPRAVDITTDVTVTGNDAAGNARSDTYNCTVGQDLVASHGSDNDFCHVRVDGCVATVDCYVVAAGNTAPFDTWTVNGCACAGGDASAPCGLN